jgi:glycosyltransferase involved in cell wall biosynthesis
MGYDAGKMLVIPNGFDFLRLRKSMSERDTRRAGFGFAADTVAIGAVGRFSPVKGFRNFVEACREVAARLPQARFVLIGRGLTEENRELMGWLKASNLADRFMLLGERDDVPACLAALDIFCLSSRSEGFPNVVGEAMCVGVPCVVTDVGDAALLIGGHGEVVPRQDSTALGQALLRVALLPDTERRTIGRAAQQRIESQFSMELARSRFENTYLDLARTNGVPR